IATAAIAALVALATVVQAVRQDSWGPIWATGWLPAVLVAWLWAPGSGKPCWPRLRGLTGREHPKWWMKNRGRELRSGRGRSQGERGAAVNVFRQTIQCVQQ